MTRPSLSVMRASAVAARRPNETTRPSQVNTPLSNVAARVNLIVRSSDVYAVPAGSRVWTAHPSAESASVARIPPCTEPIGL